MRRARRRALVLQAALEVFAEKGYHRASIADIIQQAGVARGTFYLYFESKRAVFEQLLDDAFVELGSRVRRIDPSRGPAGVLDQMEANIDGVFGCLLANRARLKVLVAHAVGLDPKFDQKLAEFYGRILGLIESALELGKQMKLVPKRLNSPVSALCILGAIKEVLFQLARGSALPDQRAVVNEILRFTVRGLLVPEVAEQLKF